MISVGAYGTTTAHLTLTDCQDAAGTINGGNVVFIAVNIYGDCGLDMYGGTITGCGNGVYVDSGCTFKMYGGAIIGNTGRGVSMVSGTFNMSGGEITGNKNGGVYVGANSNGFTVSGTAKVTGNTKSDGTVNNIYLSTGKYIIVKESFTGEIGVTAENPSTTTTIVTVSSGGFISGDGSFDYDNGAYEIDSSSGTLKEHKWSYSASGDTITASCENNGCSVSGGSVTIAAPTANTLTYDGTAKPATLVTNDWLGTDVDNIKITYRYNRSNVMTNYDGVPTDANEYEARIKLGNETPNETATVRYTIEKATLTADNFKYTAPNNLIYNGKVQVPQIRRLRCVIPALPAWVRSPGSAIWKVTALRGPPVMPGLMLSRSP